MTRHHRIFCFVMVCFAGLLVSCVLTPSTAPVATPNLPRALPQVELANTFVHELPVNGSGHKHQVWVHIPSSYAQMTKLLPVVFVTDAGYGFPLVRSISERVGRRGQNIEDFILVGLRLEPSPPPQVSRSRDYTPSNPLLDPTANPNHYSSSTYGEAQAYRDYVEHQVFPLIAKHYKADMARTVYMGQSYGGLFGAYTLLTKPELFHTYLLGSPSLWFDRRSIWQFEQAYAGKHKDLKARVMMYTGSYEAIKPEPRYTQEFDLTRDMREFESLLKSRNYPGLSITSEVLDDEDHMTMGPSFITRSLLRALPGFGPYSGE